MLRYVICVLAVASTTSFSLNSSSLDYDYDYYQYPGPTQQQQVPAEPQQSAVLYRNNNNQPAEAPVYQPLPQATPNGQYDADVLLVPRYAYVRGNINYKTIRNRPINAWLGLKYGMVGRGLARFQRAMTFEYYGSLPMDATREPRNCPQFPDLEQIQVDEARGINVDDCLTLNIYAPATTGFYPVLVFVHGEMLFDGSSEEGQPDYFLEHDVILVSINYRLAPFGFLSTKSDQMPGNTAMADIHMALEWVQQHIRTFGGNPDQVTLFGQAGGATLVHALAMSGKAQGLFQKLILQSGTALNPYFLDEDNFKTVREIERLANCEVVGKGVQSVHNCFERMSTADLLHTFKRYWEENELRGLNAVSGFKLIVGDYYGYLPKFPAALVANNTYPLLAGVAKDAGAFIMSRFYKQLQEVRTRNISDYINVVLKHTTQPRYFQTWHSWALQHIFTTEDVRNPMLANLAQGLLELTNLILYRAPLLDSIRYTSKLYPTYLYCFDYRGEFHRFGHLQNPLPFEPDATLSDDNIYLFPYPEEVSSLNAEDKQMARTLTAMWVNFATYTQPHLSPGLWPNVSTEFGPFLRFTNSKTTPLELDQHFGEGIPVPNLYPSYFTPNTTTTTTTTTSRPYYNAGYGNTLQTPPRQPQSQPQLPVYRPPYETVLNDRRPLPRPVPMPYGNYEQRAAAHAAYSQRMQTQALPSHASMQPLDH